MTRPPRIPWYREPTRAQWAAFLAAWSGWVLDAFDFTIFLLAMPAIAREFGASTTTLASSVTLTLLVRLAGGYLAGAAADRWGRRNVLLVSIVWFSVCNAAVAFAPSLAWIIVLRLVFGLGMGAEWTAGTTLAMEHWPERSRGIASGILQGSWAIGYLLAAPVFALVSPLWGWRGLFLVSLIPVLLVLPIRLWVRESPEWTRGASGGQARASAPVLADGRWRRIAWASLCMAAGFAVYYALTTGYPTMLAGEAGLDADGIAWHVALFNLGMLAGAVTCGLVATRVGVVAAVVVPALLAIPILPLYVGEVPGWLGAGAFLTGALGVGWAGVVPLFLTSMFPAEVRARSVGLTYHAGAFAAAFVATGVPALAETSSLRLGEAIGLVAAGCEVLLCALLLTQLRRTRAVTAGLLLVCLASAPGCAGGGARECVVGADCGAGSCADGQCQAAPDGGGGSAVDAAIAGCRPNDDARIDAEQMLFMPGLEASYLVAADAPADTAGEEQEDGSRRWNLAGPFPGGQSEIIALEPIEGSWYADRFTGATFARRIPGLEADTLGVFRAGEDGLLLLGLVSREGGPLRTEIAYDPPVEILHLPLAHGDSWSSTTTATGQLDGVWTTWTDSYRTSADAFGSIDTAYGEFRALRVRSEGETLLWGVETVWRRFFWFAACAGMVGAAVGRPGDAAPELTSAASLWSLTESEASPAGR